MVRFDLLREAFGFQSIRKLSGLRQSSSLRATIDQVAFELQSIEQPSGCEQSGSLQATISRVPFELQSIKKPAGFNQQGLEALPACDLLSDFTETNSLRCFDFIVAAPRPGSRDTDTVLCDNAPQFELTVETTELNNQDNSQHLAECCKSQRMKWQFIT